MLVKNKKINTESLDQHNIIVFLCSGQYILIAVFALYFVFTELKL